MKASVRSACATGVVLFLSCAALAACGDKFLVVNRGTRFERPASRRTALVLVYARPASDLARTLASVPVEATLKKAGYQSARVVSERELDQALAQRMWDLVVADAVDARVIRQHLAEGSSVVVPVVYGASSADLKQLKSEFPSIVRAPDRRQSFLDAVEDALRHAPIGHGAH